MSDLDFIALCAWFRTESFDEVASVLGVGFEDAKGAVGRGTAAFLAALDRHALTDVTGAR